MTNEPTAFDGAGDRRAAPPPGAPDAAPPAHPGDDTVTTTMLSVPADAQTEAMPDASDPGDEPPEDQTDDHGLVSPGGFPIVLRGYDRHRVDAAFADLRAELDAAVARYEVAEAALTAARSAVEDAERLAAEAKAVAQRVGRQAEDAARERTGRPTPARLAERIRQILELAEEEAAEIRTTARAEADSGGRGLARRGRPAPGAPDAARPGARAAAGPPRDPAAGNRIALDAPADSVASLPRAARGVDRRGGARVLPLECPIQPYAWGSRTTIAELQGRPTPAEGPEAELWAGAHHRAPARVAADRTLLDVIAADPERELGAESVAAFGPVLPFLLKLLAVDAPLSLQAHPSREQAQRGHDAEEAAGVPHDAPHRCYVDTWPKPELLVALTPFTALCGLRDVAATVAELDRLAVPELAPVVDRLRSGGASALPGVLRDLLLGSGGDGAGIAAMVDGVRAGAAALAARGDSDAIAADVAWLERIATAYPGDRGVLGALLLNVVRLDPGDAIYLPAGNLHAYLEGVGVEIMANSDNVLRGGLTAKHVDVEELLRVLDPTAGPAPVVHPSRVGAELVYPVPAREFRLSRVDVEPGAAVPLDRRGAQVLLCVSGEVVAATRDERVAIGGGSAVYAAAAEPALTLRGDGTVFRATAGL